MKRLDWFLRSPGDWCSKCCTGIVPLPEPIAPEYIRRMVETAKIIVHPNDPEFERT